MTQRDEDCIDQAYVDWQTSVRFTQHGQPAKAPAIAAAGTVAELFAADGERFVRLAFRTLLDRDPSGEELRHHLELLRCGTSKATLAARLRYSAEGVNRPQTLHLKSAHRLDKLGQLPVLGKAVQLLTAVAGSAGAKASLLSQHQAIDDLRQNTERLAAIDRQVIRDLVQAEEQHKLDLRRTGLLIDELRQEIKSLRDRQQELDDSLQKAQPGTAERQQSQGTPVDEGFYLAFEEHFRGSEDVIRDRLAYYLPVLAAKLPTPDDSAQVIDIGCGRGEWMGLLREQGYAVTGIDLNERNVARCRDKGLKAELADGIQWLRQTESKSLRLISSFHVIEHLSLPQLNSLLIEALRCLEPGGMIILETPNPENLVTAAHRFYTDPSHRNPLPPDLMAFILTYQGFAEVEIHRLHPAAPPANLPGELDTLLYGPQDYAVIARRP